MRSYLDPYRVEVERALEAGASISSVARALNIPRATLDSALDMWARPERKDPGAEELEALRRLVDESS